MLQGCREDVVVDIADDDTVEVAEVIVVVEVVSLEGTDRLMRNHGDSLYCQSSMLFGSPKVRSVLARSLYSPLGIFSPLWENTPRGTAYMPPVIRGRL